MKETEQEKQARLLREEEDRAREKRRREEDEESSRRLMGIAMGDMLGTGIPGGIDMDITTPL